MDKWYLDLPDHLQYDLGSHSGVSSSSKQLKKPLPNVLALHMHYWTTVLILHRRLWVVKNFSSSFIHFYIGLSSIAHLLHRKEKHTDDEDQQTQTRISRHYEMCRTAAIHVATLFSIYKETYLFERCSALLIYCLFSAAILLDADGVFFNSDFVMHTDRNKVSKHPDDPQARLSLSKCKNGLNDMGVIWPSAARALTLFTGAKSEATDASMVELTRSSTRERNKRPAEQQLEDSFSRTSDIAGPQLSPPSGPTHFDYVPPRAQSVSNIGNSQLQQPQHSLPNRADEVVDTGVRAYIPFPLVPLPSAASAGYTDASAVENPSYLDAFPELSTTILPQLYSSGLIDNMEGSFPNMQSRTDLHQQPQEYHAYSAGNVVPPYSYQPNMFPRLRQYELQDTAPEGMHQRPRHDQQLRVGQQLHGMHHTARHQQQVYLPQNYNVYSKFSSLYCYSATNVLSACVSVTPPQLIG